MRNSISEAAKLSGVSVRTLHYYDQIGLLKPSEVISETGYRYYSEADMERLQQILFYRELDFPLKEIMKMMNASEYSKEEALVRQKELLMLERKRLDRLIDLLDASLKGERTMSFKEFDRSEIEAIKEKYAREAQERWGNTEAFAQSRERTAAYGKEEWKQAEKQMDELLMKFSKHLGESPECREVQELVEQWQRHITDYYYDCTKEILAGLGMMYMADERFTEHMDKFGKGIAQLISDAIAVYCRA